MKQAHRLIYPLMLLLASGPALAEGFAPKAGLWEVSTERRVYDGRDVTEQAAAARDQALQQAMASMTPEQRKQIEAMGLLGSDKTGAHPRICVSAAMAALDKPAADPRTHCEPSNIKRSGSKTTFEFNCASGGVGTVGKGEITSAGGTYRTRADLTFTDPRGSHTQVTETEMRYLGADCRGIKPFDEIGPKN